MKNLNRYVILLMCISIISCTNSDLEPSLEQDKEVEGSIVDVSNLYSLIKGAYSTMNSSTYYGRDLIINNEVRTDNCFSNGNSGRFTTQASLEYLPTTAYIWDDSYEAIAAANIIIAADVDNLEGDQLYGKHIQGQAYLIRALAHYDLLRTYGQMHVGGVLGIPYVTEFKGENLFPSRNTIEENKTSIMADLNTAFNMMSDAYFDSSKEFFSKYAAKAIESRVAIYFGMWTEARDAAQAVISSGLYSIISADDYVNSWSQDGSTNSIFELAFNDSDNLGNTSASYIYRTQNGTGTYGDIEVLPNVSSLYEAGDVRANILGYEGARLRNINKYPGLIGSNNLPLIRYEEIILNYAEALFEISGESTALTEINKITSNRGAAAYTSLTKEDILNERRKELIFEGFRFDDLMRTGSDLVKSEIEQNFLATIPYGDYRLAWPIPQDEMDANSNMEQNDGY